MQTNMVQCRSRRRSAWARLSVGLVLFIATLVVSTVGASAARVAPGPVSWMEGQGNPAAIGAQVPTFRLYVTPLDVTVGNNTWALADIDYYLDKYIPADARRQFIADIPGDSFRLTGQGTGAVQLGIGSLSASVGVRALVDGGVAGDMLELVLLGNELDVPYALTGTSFDMAVFGDAAVGLSVPIGSALRVGARYHQLYGLAYGYAEADGQFVIRSDEPGVDGEGLVKYGYTHVESEGGTIEMAGEGTAFDVGVSYQLSPSLAVGAAVLDWGQIRWSAVTSQVCTVAVETGEGFDVTEGMDEVGTCDDEEAVARDWQLPRRVEVSVGWRPFRSVHLGASYTHSLTAANAGSGNGFFSVGDLRAAVTWDLLRLLQLNASATLLGKDGVSVSTGAALRLGPLMTRARISNVQLLFGEGAGKSVGFGVDMGIVF